MRLNSRPSHFSPGKKPDTQWIGHWVELGGGLDVSERKNLSCLYRNSNPGPSSPQSSRYDNCDTPTPPPEQRRHRTPATVPNFMAACVYKLLSTMFDFTESLFFSRPDGTPGKSLRHPVVSLHSGWDPRPNASCGFVCILLTCIVTPDIVCGVFASLRNAN